MKDLIVGQYYIATSPKFRGGAPYIVDRHVGVELIADLYVNHSVSAERIASDYDLTPAQVHAALAYYYDHPDEIKAIWDQAAQIEAELAPSPEERAARQAELEQRLKDRDPEAYRKLMEFKKQGQ